MSENVLFQGFNVVTQTVLISIGLIGNMMTIVVFCSSKLKTISPFKYLASLAVTDSLILVTNCLEVFLNSYDFFFSAYFFSFYLGTIAIAKLSSAWLMVAFSYNRYASLKNPLYAKNQWILKNTKFVISMIFFGSTLIFVVEVITGQFVRTGVVFEILRYLLDFLIPFPIIVFMNVLTYHMLLKYKNKREKALGNSNSNTSNKFTVTKMLWISSAMYLFLVPNEIVYGLWLLHFCGVIGYDSTNLAVPWQKLFNIFISFSYCGDFFVYCLSGKMFRSSLFEVMLKLVKKLSPFYQIRN